MNDMVNSPAHYFDSAIECIDAMQEISSHEQFIGFLRLNAFKYLWRLDKKDSVLENIEKCIWYLNRLRTECKNKADDCPQKGG